MQNKFTKKALKDKGFYNFLGIKLRISVLQDLFQTFKETIED